MSLNDKWTNIYAMVFTLENEEGVLRLENLKNREVEFFTHKDIEELTSFLQKKIIVTEDFVLGEDKILVFNKEKELIELRFI